MFKSVKAILIQSAAGTISAANDADKVKVKGNEEISLLVEVSNKCTL